MSIFEQIKTTNCLNWTKIDTCDYLFPTFPSLIGACSFDSVKYLKTHKDRKEAFRTSDTNPLCYDHFTEITCHILVPKCDASTGQVIHPCKEGCYDMTQMCKDDPGANKIFGDSWEFDCDYIPSVMSSTLCFYKPVTCYDPPHIQHAVKWRPQKPCLVYLFSLHEVVKYFCKSGFKIIGNSTITCMSSGQWSELPQCLPDKLREVNQNY